MATEIGTAYVSILPSFQGIQSALSAGLAGPSEAAGLLGGKKAGTGLTSGIAASTGGIGALIKNAAVVPILGIGAAAIASATKVDAANDQIIKSTGASGKVADSLQQSLKNVASTSPAGLQDIATAIGDVFSRTNLTGPALEGLTDRITTFNRITKDGPLNVEELTRTLAGFNVPAKAMGGELDNLFRVAQRTGVPLNDLITSLGTAGPIVRQFGIPIEQSAGLLATLNKAGIDSTALLPGLRKAFVGFAKEGKAPAKGLRDTVGALEDLIKQGDIVGAQQLAVQVFGARGSGLVDAAVQGKLSLDALSKSFGTTGKGILQTASATDDAAESFGEFRNIAELALATIGKPVFDAASAGMRNALPVVRGLADGFQALPKPVQEAAVGVAALGLAAPLVAKLLTPVKLVGQAAGGIATGVGTASTKLGEFFTAGGGLDTIRLAFGRVAEGAGAIGTKIGESVVALANLGREAAKKIIVKLESKLAVSTAQGTASGVGGAAGGGIATLLLSKFKDILPLGAGGAGATGEAGAAGALGTVALPIIAALSIVGLSAVFHGKIEDAFTNVIPKSISIPIGVSLLTNPITAIGASLVGAGVLLGNLVDDFSGTVDSITGAAGDGLDAIGGFASGVGDLLAPVGDVFTGLGSTIADALAGAPDAISGFFSDLPGIISSAGQSILSFVQGLPGQLASFVTQVPGILTALPGQIAEALLTEAADFVNSIVTVRTLAFNALVSLGSTVVDAIGQIPGLVGDALNQIPGLVSAGFSGLLSLGGDLISFLVTGAQTQLPNLFGFLASLPGLALGALGDLGTLAFGGGGRLLEGLLDGVKTGVPALLGFIGSLPSKIISGIGDLARLLVKAGGQIVDGLIQGISRGAGKLGDALDKLLGGVPSKVLDFFGISSPSKLMADIATEIPAGLAQGLLQGAAGLLGAAGQLGTQILSGIGDLATLGLTKATELGAGLLSGITSGVGALVAFVAGIPGTIIATLGDLATSLLLPGVQLITGFLGGIVQAVPAVVGFLASIPAAAITWIGDTLSSLISKGLDLIQGFINGMAQNAGNVLAFVAGIPGALASGLGDLLTGPASLVSKGVDLIQGFINGIIQKAADIVGAIKKHVTDVIPDFIAKPLGIRSPSTVTRDLGRMVSLGFAVGIEDEADRVARAAADITALAAAPGVTTVDLRTARPATPAPAGNAGGGDRNITLSNVWNPREAARILREEVAWMDSTEGRP